MPIYSYSGTFDRRSALNFYLSMLVDVSVCYRRHFGEAVALTFMADQAIPVEIVQRVLDGETLRPAIDVRDPPRAETRAGNA